MVATQIRSAQPSQVYAPQADSASEPVTYATPADEIGPLSRNAFGVYVCGDSMVGEGINDGDLVWVEPGMDARAPCVVLARVEAIDGHHSGRAVKTLARDGFLYSHPAGGAERFVCRSFTVIGLVVGVQPPARALIGEPREKPVGARWAADMLDSALEGAAKYAPLVGWTADEGLRCFFHDLRLGLPPGERMDPSTARFLTSAEDCTLRFLQLASRGRGSTLAGLKDAGAEVHLALLSEARQLLAEAVERHAT